MADIDEPVGERRQGPHHAGQHLSARQRFERLWRRGREDHLAAFAHDEQLVTRQRDAAGAELILTPLDRAGLELDGAQARTELLPAVVPVQVAVVVHARGVVIRERLV